MEGAREGEREREGGKRREEKRRRNNKTEQVLLKRRVGVRIKRTVRTKG